MLESKAIQSIKNFDGNRANYKEWLFKLKNILIEVSQDSAFDFWIEAAERSIKAPSLVYEYAKNNSENFDEYENTYRRIATALSSLFINKLEENT